jgi:hypothetical protein
MGLILVYCHLLLAKNTGGSNLYATIDPQPNNATVFYKILAVDVDGRKTISNTRTGQLYLERHKKLISIRIL